MFMPIFFQRLGKHCSAMVLNNCFAINILLFFFLFWITNEMRTFCATIASYYSSKLALWYNFQQLGPMLLQIIEIRCGLWMWSSMKTWSAICYFSCTIKSLHVQSYMYHIGCKVYVELPNIYWNWHYHLSMLSFTNRLEYKGQRYVYIELW